jgi:amino acid transporter
VNVVVLSFIIFCGATKANPANWYVQVANVSWTDANGLNQTCAESKRCGGGGFAPFGVAGVLGGAAKCFYAFAGFDVIASTGEEVINPKRNIPASIVITLIVVSLLYCGLSAVLTLMIPYYVLSVDTPLPHAFDYVGLDWAKWVVSIGSVLSLCTWYANTSANKNR